MAAAKKAASSRGVSGPGDGDVGALRVSAPLVQVRLGSRVLHLSAGDVVPEGVSQDQINHLSDLGYVTDGGAAEVAGN